MAGIAKDIGCGFGLLGVLVGRWIRIEPVGMKMLKNLANNRLGLLEREILLCSKYLWSNLAHLLNQ